MSSFFFERQQVHCNCFDNSPKNAPTIFRTDPHHLITHQNKQTKQQFPRNPSQHGKNKKKSLKKERNPSLTASQRDPKQKQDSNLNLFIPDIQPSFTTSQTKKQQRISVSDHFQQPLIGHIKSERNKPSHMIRSQRPQIFYEPVNFWPNYKINIAPISVENCQKKLLNEIEYDQQITREFEKDFIQFKLHRDKVESQPSQRSIKHKNKEASSFINKSTAQINQYLENQSRIRYPVTQHIILIPQKNTPQRATSFRNSAVSERQKPSTKKQKNKMFPKQIESQKGSSNGSSSGRESVFLGHGFDGLTQKRQSFQQIEANGKKDQKQNRETMITQESNIINSQIKTMTEYSHNLTSPKSQQNIGMAFGGGNKYGVAGMSYQDIGEIKGPKLSSLRKFYL